METEFFFAAVATRSKIFVNLQFQIVLANVCGVEMDRWAVVVVVFILFTVYIDDD